MNLQKNSKQEKLLEAFTEYQIVLAKDLTRPNGRTLMGLNTMKKYKNWLR